MAILYVIEQNEPKETKTFPPSIESSSWLADLTAYANSKSDFIPEFGAPLKFSNRAELDTFLDTYTLRDASLLADLAAWKSSHNVVLTNKFYYTIDSVPSDGQDPVGIV
jgi:hypothetical protein